MPKSDVPCLVCNPAEASAGDYCDEHREELHRLDHEHEGLFRLQRVSRGKDHETYNVMLRGECDPCGRILVTETDPENLTLTVLLADDLNLETPIAEYTALMMERTYGDQLRKKIRQEIIHSWYGNARACVDIFRTSMSRAVHWDVAAREDQGEEEGGEPHGPAGKASVH